MKIALNGRSNQDEPVCFSPPKWLTDGLRIHTIPPARKRLSEQGEHLRITHVKLRGQKDSTAKSETIRIKFEPIPIAELDSMTFVLFSLNGQMTNNF